MANNATAIIGFLILLVGTILNIVGHSTNDWLITERRFSGYQVHIGLYRGCVNSICINVDTYLTIDGSYLATRILSALSVTASGIGCLLAIFFFVQVNRVFSTKSSLPIVTYIMSFLSVGLTVSALAVFGADIFKPISSLYKLGYSFYLCAAAAVLVKVGGIVHLVGAKQIMASLPHTMPPGQVIAPGATTPYVYHTQQNTMYAQAPAGHAPQPAGYIVQTPQGYAQQPAGYAVQTPQGYGPPDAKPAIP